MADLIGQLIGPYKITRILGVGGMATVYHAEQVNIRRTVAIKVIETTRAADPAFRERFQREAEIVASLDHPHILDLYDFGQQDDLIYFVMDLKVGSLAQHMQNERLSLAQIDRMLDQVCDALTYAHSKGIVHRDLKPHNVLLDEGGNATLTDFGIAKVLGDDITALTQSGTYVGTPQYMAPEQWRGEPVDIRSDIYALGVILFEMLTGLLPFRSQSHSGMMYHHLFDEPPRLPELTPELYRVVKRAMAKEPAMRYQTANDLLQDFRAIRPKIAPVNLPLPRPAPPARPDLHEDTSILPRNKGPKPIRPIKPITSPTEHMVTIPTGNLQIIGVLAVAVLTMLVFLGARSMGFSLLPVPDAAPSSPTPLTPVVVLPPTPTPQLPRLAPLPWTPVKMEFNGVPMVRVPAGCFYMGSMAGDPDEQPVHPVCFSRPFWIDEAEVSQQQFGALGGSTELKSFFSGPTRPVERITWYEAQTFCQARGGRLPTEAEWEYAARGPQGPEYPWGTWNPDQSVWNRDEKDGTSAVGRIPTNASWVGALDMSGNVAEWVADWYGSSYTSERQDDPPGPSSGALRIFRGGAWNSIDPLNLRAAYRDWLDPTTATRSVGLRCMREISAQESDITPTPITATGAVWQVQEQAFGGVPMVLVPSGCFQMGSVDGDEDERPAHQVCVNAEFWIDKYEVSNQQFVELGGVGQAPSQWTSFSLPRETVSWDEAEAFCKLRGGRLPTEAEWEYAARGPQNRIFPWGNTWFAARVTYASNAGRLTAPVASRPDGVSWVGALNMVGNVREWVSDNYKSYPYSPDNTVSSPDKVTRGGSWLDTSYNQRASDRFYATPNHRNNYTGFRCVR